MNRSMLAENNEALEGALEETFPCSLVQKRHFRDSGLPRGGAALNIAMRWRLEGAIRDSSVEQAFQALVDRHEILRTGFGAGNGTPVQHVRSSQSFKLSVIDLSRLPESQRDAEAIAIGTREARASFDLGSAPLLRATLLRLDDRRAIILVTVHHTVADGWSIGVLIREFGTFAAAIESGRTARLPDIDLQYADFALWQQDYLASQATGDAQSYWMKKLRGMPDFRVKPDIEPAGNTTNAAEIRSILLPKELTDSLALTARKQSNTLFHISAASLAAMLRRVTGQSDLVIGTQVAARDDMAVEALVGPLVNTVLLRFDASGGQSFSDFAQRCSETIRDAIAHQNMAFENVIEMLDGDRDPCRMPLHSINYVLQQAYIDNASADDSRYGDLDIVSLPSHTPGALWDLNFFMVGRTEGWRISCEYKSDLFLASTVDRLLRQWQATMEAACANPNVLMSDLTGREEHVEDAPAIGKTEIEAEFPCSALQAVFFNQQSQNPGDTTLNISARWEVKGEVDTALLEKSLNSIVARHESLRAVFVKSGEVPLQRIQSKVKAALHVRDLSSLPSNEQEEEIEKIGKRDSALPFNIESAPVLRLTFLRRGPGDGELLLTTHQLVSDCFSSGIFARDLCETYRLLTKGAGKTQDLPLHYSDYTVWQKSWLNSSASTAAKTYWKNRLETLKPFHVPAALDAPLEPTMRGDIVTRPIAQHVIDSVNAAGRKCGATFFMFGAAALAATLKAVTAQDEVVFSTQVPGRDRPEFERAIGPFTNWVVLRQHIPGDPSFAKIVDDVRMTLGDDLAHAKLPISWIDKNLKLEKRAGRRNHLTAINFLVLGTLQRDSESAGMALRGVPGFSGGTKYDLNFFFIQRPDGWTLSCEFDPDLFNRDHVQKLLENYLKVIEMGADNPGVGLSELGISSGKVDTAPAIEPDRQAPRLAAPNRHSVAAGNNESVVAGIWSEVLKFPDIQPHHNFFELGGDSFAAAEMLTRVNKVFGKELLLSSLFRRPVLKDFTEALSKEDVSFSDPRIIEINAEGKQTPVIAINSSILLYEIQKHLGSDRRYIGLKFFEGVPQEELPPRTMEEIAADYAALLRQTQPRGPYILVGLCVHGILAMAIAHKLRKEGEEVALVALKDSWAPHYVRRRTKATLLAGKAYDVWRNFLKVYKGDQTVAGFLATYSKIRRTGILDFAVRQGWLDHVPSQTGFDDADWWLKHLMDARDRYQPPMYPGRVVQFRSPDSPSGRLFHPSLGMSDIVCGRFELGRIPIMDRRTLDEGAAKLAGHIREAVRPFGDA